MTAEPIRSYVIEVTTESDAPYIMTELSLWGTGSDEPLVMDLPTAVATARVVFETLSEPEHGYLVSVRIYRRRKDGSLSDVIWRRDR